MHEYLGLHPEIINQFELSKLGLRMFIDLFFSSIVIQLVYVRRHGSNGFAFTYYMFNLITFTICFMLQKVPMDLGFALGLFAVFGILRYRTETIKTRDLTYLFVVIGIAIMNAVVNSNVTLAELLLVNIVITALTAFLEFSPRFHRLNSYQIHYDNLEIVRKRDSSLLIADLQERTGLRIHKVKIESIDLLRETVQLLVYYAPEEE